MKYLGVLFLYFLYACASNPGYANRVEKTNPNQPNSNIQSGTQPSNYAIIYVYRPKSPILSQISFDLLINSQEAGTLKNGSRLKYKIYSQGTIGVNAMFSDTDWKRSNTFLQVRHGETYFIKAGFRGGLGNVVVLDLVDFNIGSAEFNNDKLFHKKRYDENQEKQIFLSEQNPDFNSPSPTYDQTPDHVSQELPSNPSTDLTINPTTIKRLALVIGNSNYINAGTLRNPVNDARAISGILTKLGFDVMKFEDADQNQLKRAISDFGYRLKNYDAGLFYFAGHGVQVDGNNYLIPIDALLKYEENVEYECVAAGRVLAQMEGAENGLNIVILDACRNNPFERSWDRSLTSRGLAGMNAPTGSLVAYATAPGETASDGFGENGLYTEELLRNMQKPNLKIEDVFKQVRIAVMQKSGNEQVPWESSSLIGDFYFSTK